MKFLLDENNIIVDIKETENEVHPSLTWVTSNAEAEVGDSFIDGVVVPMEVPEPTYQDNRSAAYPSIEDQADMQYWDAVNGTTTWQDAIAAVKDAHPKP